MGGKCAKDEKKPTRPKGEMTLGKKIAEGGVKFVLLGEMSTGKTCMVLRLVNDEFPDRVEPTIGAAFLVHKMNVDGKNVKLEIWDTAGQERFKSLAPMYYRGASAAIIVYDITKQSSFDTMRNWVEELKQRAPPNIVLALAGNKIDLENQRVVTKEQVDKYIQELQEAGCKDLVHRECSAKSGQGVRELFEDVCKRLIQIAESEAS